MWPAGRHEVRTHLQHMPALTVLIHGEISEQWARQLPDDFKSSHRCWLWYARHAHMGYCHARIEGRKVNEGGVAWERKRGGGGVLSYSSFWRTKGRENDEGISCCPLPALRLSFFLSLFLLSQISRGISVIFSPSLLVPLFFFSPISFALTMFFCVFISLFLILAQLCLLMTCVSLAVFPFGFGKGRKPSFLHTLSFSVLTKHWLFMTANSLMLSSLPPSLSSSLFLIFALSPPLFSLSFLSRVLPPSLLGAAPAVWEQIALLLLGFGERTRPRSHLWERGRASLAYATTMC